MHISRTILSIALTSAALIASATVAAVTTQSFVLDNADAFFQGELEGTAVRSDGTVLPGAATERIAFENVPLAYSIARRGDSLFVGTGTTGAVYKVAGKKVEQFASTGELLVSSLAFGRDGALYAGTLPNGRIYRIDPKSGKTKRFAEPKGAKHIWALHYDKKRGKLIAATGPEGKLFAIDSEGLTRELYDAEASHVMALAGDGKGNLFAGTSDAALLIRLSSKGDASIVHDFPGNEITAIDVLDGRIAVAANEFKTAPGAQFKAGAPKGGRPSTRPRPGSGQLWRIEADGRTEMLVARKDTHFTDVQWGKDGLLYAAGGHEGRIFEVEPDATYSIWADVEERQVLGLALRSSSPVFIAGDSAALYRVRDGAPKNAVWTSAALDATFPSEWGRLDWRGRGRFVLETRSGNTQKPGDAWSAWSKGLKQPGRVKSPPGRFIQVRAKFPKDASAELRAVELFYLPRNQRARVSDIKGARPPLKRGEAARRPPPPTPLVGLSWKTTNPDRDPLRYRLAFREEGQSVWRDMFSEDVVLKDAKYMWDTNSIPDGYYVVRVEASDEESNPDDRALRSTAVSEPIRVDNHPPRFESLKARKGAVQGRVVDSLGPIVRIQVSVDSGPWRDVFPKDGLLDSRDEQFELSLEKIDAGTHIIAARAFDQSGNQANREITVKTK
jgi:sugar lactone lactonase YvrE